MAGAGTNRTRESISGGPTVILVEPQLGENIGMAARAMANFGLTDMRLVRPRPNWLHQKTRDASSGADFILDAAKIYSTTEDAIADLHFVYATTARERGQTKTVHGPRAAGLNLRERAGRGEAFGILFGRERTGLENEDIALADAILTYPVNPAFASLNLSQAVLLAGYTWMVAGEETLPFTKRDKSPPATREQILSFFDHIETELEDSGFFRPPEKKHVMVLNLRNMFHRMELTDQDVRTLRGVIVRLVEGNRSPTGEGARKRAARKAQRMEQAARLQAEIDAHKDPKTEEPGQPE
jgi:tRNA/rRNA methyltransferase